MALPPEGANATYFGSASPAGPVPTDISSAEMPGAPDAWAELPDLLEDEESDQPRVFEAPVADNVSPVEAAEAGAELMPEPEAGLLSSSSLTVPDGLEAVHPPGEKSDEWLDVLDDLEQGAPEHPQPHDAPVAELIEEQSATSPGSSEQQWSDLLGELENESKGDSTATVDPESATTDVAWNPERSLENETDFAAMDVSDSGDGHESSAAHSSFAEASSVAPPAEQPMGEPKQSPAPPAAKAPAHKPSPLKSAGQAPVRTAAGGTVSPPANRRTPARAADKPAPRRPGSVSTPRRPASLTGGMDGIRTKSVREADVFSGMDDPMQFPPDPLFGGTARAPGPLDAGPLGGERKRTSSPSTSAARSPVLKPRSAGVGEPKLHAPSAASKSRPASAKAGAKNRSGSVSTAPKAVLAGDPSTARSSAGRAAGLPRSVRGAAPAARKNGSRRR